MSSSNGLPNEVWEKILSHLYPSQLSRMSMVDKNLSEIVSSLKVWPRMFHAAHGSKAQLRPLMCIPRFKNSHMIFMCASSLHVCEKCFGLTGYNAIKLYMLPLPIPVLLPRRSTDAIKYVGDRFDPNWTIRMCLPCRQGHISDFEEPIPLHVENIWVNWNTLIAKYPCAPQISRFYELHGVRGGNQMIEESVVFKIMQQLFGGDVGIKAFEESTESWDKKTETRIRWYQLQE
ncbi:hypothetical protein BGZ91_010644 [Linnemannia elongata]|nr:hypothetical protein BGZ91_010644 [Linnemannia elongata]KAG0070630.1 hypothetical protein BGZ90_012561 [Linnemannia elongata]